MWDVASEAPLYNFRGHHGRLLCVAWSKASNREGEGVIYSGADDYTVHRWFASDQQFKEPPKSRWNCYKFESMYFKSVLDSVVQQIYIQKKKNTKKRARQSKNQRTENKNSIQEKGKMMLIYICSMYKNILVQYYQIR